MYRGVSLGFWITSALLGCTALFLTFLSIGHREDVEQLFIKRETVLGLADELRQSSDDLTRFARSYAATTDPRFLDRFRTVLAIREGEMLRPSGYQYVYWDLEIVGDLDEAETGDIKSLEQRLVDAGIGSEPLYLLNRAKRNSDRLVKIEDQAFQLIEAGQTSEALQLLFGESYHRAKAGILSPVRTLQQMVDTQMAKELDVASEKQQLLDTMAIATLLGSVIFGALAGLWRKPRTSA